MMESLKGQLLVAMPSMIDTTFEESVVFLVGHGEDEGAMGLVVNQSMPDMHMSDILLELELGEPDELIQLPESVRDRDILFGGPVEKGRGFVLHSPDYFKDGNSVAVNGDVCLTATLDVLKAITFGPAPRHSLLALGYCGWSPGQLEDEIRANGWLTTDASADLIFDTPVDERYELALSGLGVTRASLSSEAGNA